MIRDLKISAVLNGYVVTVGCQTVVFNSRPDMLKELDRYLDKPEEREAYYRQHAVNSEKCLGMPTPENRATTYTVGTASIGAPFNRSAPESITDRAYDAVPAAATNPR